MSIQMPSTPCLTEGCPNAAGRDFSYEIAWWEITGYDRDRDQGGTNAVFNRKRTGRILCPTCQTRLKYAGQKEQTSIFDQVVPF